MSFYDILLAQKLNGGGGGDGLITITEADYQALSIAEKNNGKIYKVEGYELTVEKETIPRTQVATPNLVVSSFYQTGFEGYKAINGSTSDGWLPNAASDNSLIYTYDSPEKPTRVKLQLENRNPSGQTGTLYIYGSNDGGTTWDTIHSETFTASSQQNVLYEREYDLSDNDNFYKMIKIQGTFINWAWWLMELNVFTNYEKTHFYYMDNRYEMI